jgi:hypothetical protein
MLRKILIFAGAALVVALVWLVLSVWITPFALGQSADPLVTTGQVMLEGRAVAYRVRHLPISSFPELPQDISTVLIARGCLIPQTYQAHRPENVIHGALERAGTSDWAVLCSVEGRVSLLVFFASGAAASPVVLADHAETERLQTHDASGSLGFNWGIDPATPADVHEAQAAMAHRPAAPDHDAVADSVIDRNTVYHLYRNGAWDRLIVD